MTDVSFFFDVASVSVALSGCVIAVYFDLAKGRVPNKLTGLMLFTSLMLAAARIMAGDPRFLLQYVAAICFGFLAGYFFWYIKAWSGGDSKMFWSISALLPVYPLGLSILFSPHVSEWAKQLFSLTFLLNLIVVLVFRAAVLHLYHFMFKKRTKPEEHVKLMPYFLITLIVSLYSDMIWLLLVGR
jgi:Flp pilus assembly protein protease CpaA